MDYRRHFPILFFHSSQFHSHQIFHVLVVAAAFIHFYGVSNLQEFRYGLEGGCTDDSLLWGAQLWPYSCFFKCPTNTLEKLLESIYSQLLLLLCFWFAKTSFVFWWTFCLASFCSSKVAVTSHLQRKPSSGIMSNIFMKPEVSIFK